jgi:hypothetical protein
MLFQELILFWTANSQLLVQLGFAHHRCTIQIWRILTKAGGTFDESYFDNYFELVQLGKNRSFLVQKVQHNIIRT